MSEENKAILMRFAEESVNKGNPGIVGDFFGENFVNHFEPPASQGSEGMRKGLVALLAAFPDLHVTVDDMIAEGDKVMFRATVSGTHKGEFAGIAPTGKHVTFTTVGYDRYANGKMVERWERTDVLGLLQQIGGIPT